MAQQVITPESGAQMSARLETVEGSAVSMSDVALSCPSQLEEEDDDGDEDDGGLSSPKDDETNLFSVDFEIFGKVQGVFCRKYTQERGEELGIRGWCKNSSRGSLIGVLQGETEQVEKMKLWLESSASPKSRVVRVEFRNEHPLMLMEERLHSLQRGLENLSTVIDHLERKLDEQTDVFQRLRGDLEHLETKIYHVTSTTTDTRCSVHTEENQNHEARYNAKFNNVTESATRIQSDRLKSIETNR